MKKIPALLSLLFFVSTLFAQKISDVDFDSIKKKIDTEPALYKNLMKRFLESDTSLTKTEVDILYYGQCFQPDYSPYGSDPNAKIFQDHYRKEEFKEALVPALAIIEKNPMDLQMTFKVLVCYHYLHDEVNKLKIATRYNYLLLPIFESGDGRTANTAFVVMRISDEYEMMAHLRVENTLQSLSGDCDVMTLKPNELGLEKLYFNVSKLLETFSKRLK